MSKAIKYIVLILLVISPAQFKISQIKTSDKPENTEKVKLFGSLVKTPSKHHFNYLKMFSSSSGFASGVFLLSYKNQSWNLVENFEQTKVVFSSFAVDENNIYFSTLINPLSESELYFYNGKVIIKIDHPFGNTISTIFLTTQKKLWIGGDREIAFYDGTWHNLPYPESMSRIEQIYANDNNEAWITTQDNKLFYYSQNKWTQYLPGELIKSIDFKDINSGYILTENKILSLHNFGFSLLLKNELLRNVSKIFSIKPNSIWLIGPKGLIIHCKNQTLDIVPTNATENLTTLSFVSDEELWIGGQNGTIVKVSNEIIPQSAKKELNFNGILPVPYARNLDDQYGVGIEDLNNDGFKDIYVVSIFRSNNFYLNNLNDSIKNASSKNLNFSDETLIRNLTGLVPRQKTLNYSKLQLGVGIADIDNDGDEDIYICSLMDKNKVLLNDGNGYFRDVSDQSGRGCGEVTDRTNAAIFADVDNDGDLDIFITNEYSTNRLYENNGNGYFTEITADAGVSSTGGSMGASFADVDNDGLPDLCVANWARQNNIYKNVSSNGKIKFIEVSETAGTGGDPSSKSNAVVFADYNNDGLIDLLITNRGSYNCLYKNIGNFKFIDVTEETLGLKRLQSYGAVFGDFDNDGYQELYIANVGRNLMLKYDGNNKFTDVTFSSGTEMVTYSTGAAIGDLDNDGDLDLYCASFTDGSSALFINKVNSNQFVTIKLEGTNTNRDAVGAKVWFYKKGHANQKEFLIGYRQVISGTGYCSHNSREIHFGTGINDTVDIIIEFSLSSPQKILKNIKAGSHLFLSEVTGSERSFIFFRKSLIRFFIDPEIRVEILKFLFALILIIISIVNGRDKYKWNWRYIFFTHGTAAFIFTSLILVFMHREFFLSIFVPLSFIIIYITLVHLIFERVILVKKIKTERENTRNKIARDLHDDLASTISGSKLYLEVLSNSISTDVQSKNILSIISMQLSEAYEKISDLVWTISPLHDSLKDLIARIRYHVREQCEANKIAYKNFSDIRENDYRLTDEIRRNIYYIFKEACHNSVQHSEANEITLTTTLSDKVLKIQFEDNGKGIDSTTLELMKSGQIIPGSLHGNGISNIIKRASEIEGKIDISSHPEIGTSISLELKMR